MASWWAPALPRRVSERNIPVVLWPTMAVKVEAVAVLIVIATPRLLSSVVPSFIAPLFPAIFAPVIAVRVPGAAFFAIARNLAILQVRVSRTPELVGSLLLSLQPLLLFILFHEIAIHPLKPFARHLHLANGPDRGKELPATMLASEENRVAGQVTRGHSPELRFQTVKIGPALVAQVLEEATERADLLTKDLGPFFCCRKPLLGVHDALHVRLERPEN